LWQLAGWKRFPQTLVRTYYDYTQGMPGFDYDVIIAGSGPAGVSTWLHLNRYGRALAARTLVLEKAQHPRHKLCGGGVAQAADVVLRRLRIRVDVPSVAIHNVDFRYCDKHFYWRLTLLASAG
jgi:ribulose 1,5-bisphosphate synthetase/thiazole synthase